MKYLVTGASGFIGRRLCRSLADQGETVIRASRINAGDKDSGHFFIEYWLDGKRWEAVLCDVDVVIHLAARVHQAPSTTSSSEAESMLVNCEYTKVLANACVTAGVKRLVFMSTVHVNGTHSGKYPFREDDEPKPIDAYARSKLQAEHEIEKIFYQQSSEYVIVRPPLVYGPECGANFLRLLKIVRSFPVLPFGDFGNRRSMIYVDNLVSFLQTVSTAKLKHRTYLVSDGEDLSFRHLLRELSDAMERRILLLPIPKVIVQFLFICICKGAEYFKIGSELRVDPGLALADFDWRPPINIKDAIEKTVRWFKS